MVIDRTVAESLCCPFPSPYFCEYRCEPGCVSAGRGTTYASKGRHMFQLARVHSSTLPARLLSSSNQSLAKQNRKPLQVIENNHQRTKSIASFCRLLAAPRHLLPPICPSRFACHQPQVPKSPRASVAILPMLLFRCHLALTPTGEFKV